MALHINLLAEAQALEELRRRDPVKRVILAGLVLVMALLVWSSSLMVKGMIFRGDLSRLQGALNSRTNEYRQILESQQKLNDGKLKLAALRQLATNRFLMGDLLNSLQLTTVENVQLVHLKVVQTYTLTEETKPKPGDARPAPAKPARATEKITLTLNAKDVSSAPGDGVNKYQVALSAAPFFQQALGKANQILLVNLGTPQPDPDGKLFVLFALEARFPDKSR
jgi:hypothetical protein